MTTNIAESNFKIKYCFSIPHIAPPYIRKNAAPQKRLIEQINGQSLVCKSHCPGREPLAAIAQFCEGVLLESGFIDEAYARYAVEATYTTTNVATFKTIVKKYLQVPRVTILRDLVASRPGQEGKWFAAAKDAGFFELAIELANRSPADPRTLIRAAKDYAVKRPEFALAAGMTALRGIANGWGYDITGVDVLDAFAVVIQAARAAGVDEAVVKADVRALIAESGSGGELFSGCWPGS